MASFFSDVENGELIFSFVDILMGIDILTEGGYETSRAGKIRLKDLYIKDLEMLEKELKDYLCFEDSHKKVEYFIYLQDNLSEVESVISFNYTKTYEKYIPINATVFHPHGSLDDNIILGIPLKDSGRLFRKASKDIKKIARNLTITDSDLISANIIPESYIEKSPGFTEKIVTIMGCSLGEPDWSFLKIIIGELKLIKRKVHIFYHNESASSSLVENVMNMYGDEDAQTMINRGQIRFIPYETLH